MTQHYALPNARMRGMASKLLTPEQKQALVAAPRLDDALRQLQGTVYGPRLAEAAERRDFLLPIERAFERSLIDAYVELIHTLGGWPQAVLVEMMRHLELDNLKAILRGLARGAPPDEIQPLLLPLGRYGRIPVEKLLAVTNVPAAVTALGDMPYARVLRDALATAGREFGLFPLEVALDISYYRGLWATAQHLSGEDRSRALPLLGTRFDTINVDWIVRYKVIYHLSAVEIFNYTLPFGRRIKDEVIRQAGAAADEAGLIAALPEPYRGMLAPVAAPDRIWQLEVTLNRYFWHQARGALGGYPFHIAAIMGYLWLKEAEVHDLESILEGKRLGRSPDDVRAFLWGEL